MTELPAAWYVDPSGRHEQRFWNGTAWTVAVADGGVQNVDPSMEPPAAPISVLPPATPVVEQPRPDPVASPSPPLAPTPPTPGEWRPDPSLRHELRYWDGNAWTTHVADNGVGGVDPEGPEGSARVTVPDSIDIRDAAPSASAPVARRSIGRRLLVAGLTITAIGVVLAALSGGGGGAAHRSATRTAAEQTFLDAMHKPDADKLASTPDSNLLELGRAICDSRKAGANGDAIGTQLLEHNPASGPASVSPEGLGYLIGVAEGALCPKYVEKP